MVKGDRVSDQLLVGPNGDLHLAANGQHSPPAWGHHQIPTAKEAAALNPSQGLGLCIQLP